VIKKLSKKHWFLIGLAAVILFCLWYTRPIGWNDIAADYGDVREIKADVSIREYDGTWEHRVDRSYDLNVSGESDTGKALLALLEDNSYRPMLRTILPVSSLEGGDSSGSELWVSLLSVNLIYEEDVIHLSFMGDRLCFSSLSTNGLRGYIIDDPSVSDDLAILIRDRGTPESEYHPSSG